MNKSLIIDKLSINKPSVDCYSILSFYVYLLVAARTVSDIILEIWKTLYPDIPHSTAYPFQSFYQNPPKFTCLLILLTQTNKQTKEKT